MPERYFEHVPPEFYGRLEIKARPPAYASATIRYFVLQTVRLDAVSDELVFVIPMEQLNGMLAGLELTVVDGATGRPVPQGDVALDSFDLQRKLDSSGFVSYERLAPGKRPLRIHAPGFAGFSATITLEPGETLDLGEIALLKPTSVRGVVTDTNGNPLAVRFSLNRFVEGDPSATLDMQTAKSVTTDESGRFEAENLAPGGYVVRFGEFYQDGPGPREPTWSVAPFLVELGERVENLEIVLHPTQPLVVKPAAPEAAGVRFVVTTLDGLPYRRGVVRDTPVALHLAPGDYELRVADASGGTRIIAFRLGSTPAEILVAP
jgi:hypothetical protein